MLPKPISWFLAFAGLFLTWPILATAQSCGDAGSACEVESGSYHMIRPVGASLKGIVMHLHGGGGTGKGMLKSGLAREAISRRYVFVAPNGEHPEQRWKRDWSVRADTMRFDRDDLDFLKTVLRDVRGKLKLASAPVLLAGFSRGGSMVWNIACEDPKFADAYAPIAGAFWDSLPAACQGPVQLFHTHGWTDRTVPLEGRSFGAIVQGDVWASLKILRETNGCSKRQPEKNSFDGEVWLRHWTDCRAGQIHLLLHKGGHGAPRGWSSRIMNWFEAGQ